MQHTIYVPMNGETDGWVGPNGKKQTNKIRNYLKRNFPSAKITFNSGHYYCSAHLDFGQGRIIYLVTSDYRFFPQHFLVRIAESEFDYTGGPNHMWDGFDKIGLAINDLKGENKWN